MSQVNVNQIVDASGGVLAPISSVMRNRIINGAMVIDQRNAGASVTLGAVNPQYTLDRWFFQTSQASKLSTQQNAGSVTPPVGFTNYLGITSLSAYSALSSDYFALSQRIEGFNITDLGWGTANAKTVTLSFQVYSSLTGTFGGAVVNGAFNRSYPFTFSIPSANTWTNISVTIAGDTTGTWNTTNGEGLRVSFNLGSGSAYAGTAGSWQAAGLLSATGATSVVGTNGATFYITGVQLERGTQATSFEYRQYGQELALCRRYFRKLTGTSATPLSCQGAQYLDANAIYFSYQADLNDMRSSPTATLIGTANTDYAVYNTNFGPQAGFTFSAVSYTNFGGVQFQCTKTAHGLTSVPQLYFGTGTTNGSLNLSSEL